MRTIMFQSDMRANDPVGGCYKYIQDLQAQIEYHKAELDLVLQQLAIFRAQQQQPQLYGGGDQVLNNNNNSGDSLGFYNYHYLQQQLPPVQQEQDQYLMVQHEGSSNNNNNESNGSNTPLQQHINTWAMQNSVSLSSLSLHGQSSNASDEFADHKPMLDIPSDERNELGFDSDEIVQHRFVCLFVLLCLIMISEHPSFSNTHPTPQSLSLLVTSLFIISNSYLFYSYLSRWLLYRYWVSNNHFSFEKYFL